jgi:20S proteasome alpha/beta subunit
VYSIFEAKYKKSLLNKKPMTCIIAGNCSDGIVLVADRKVRYGNGNVAYREKIFMDYYPYVIASSGDTTLFDNFRKEALQLAQKSLGIYDEKQEFKSITFDPKNILGIVQKYSNPTTYPIIPDTKYLEGLKQIFNDKKADIKRNKDRYAFDILIAYQIDNREAQVYCIDDNGVMNRIYEPHIIIGSDTAQVYGSMFVKPFYGKNLTMEAFTELAYFTIKYIDRFNIDDTVGLGGKNPLVYLIPHDGKIAKAPDALLYNWESNSKKILDKFESDRIEGFL